ncbi:DUF2971 domain-containing protein [Janthinobacterium sp. 1_2014MBL_MicDiv]|uniref:DUF2971 domain-containing protein n=1 Tax=Janthinobacterium sp. 1_2014MBL_MicDiv TaxID=1644131 RepID=UPI0012EC6AC0|nr:DUF2971 domain-containing protein [Janthinobacterium sp. 1_2014MBL_MicDiv]
MTNTLPATLRRYTDLTSLLHILSSGEITLLDPKSWDDRNDAYFMSQYKEYKGLKSILALCFSEVPETYHHWHVFSKGPSGICIRFNGEKLLEKIKRQNGISFESIEYLTLKDAQNYHFTVERLPFLKRAGYKPEGEFRVIYESKKKELPFINIPITRECIRDIILSPWLHDDLYESAKKAVQSVNGFENMKVLRSTLISNDTWKKYASDLNEI